MTEAQMLGWYLAYGQDDLDLHILHMFKGTFLIDMAHIPVVAYMPYLTLWDKISQNLTHLECNSHKKIQISQNFQTILQQFFFFFFKK